MKPAKITTEQVKKLRIETRAPVMECRMALEKYEGDEKKAKDWLKAKGLERADKKSTREVKSGLVESYTHQGGKIGVLVEIACETDFVARTDDFKNLAHELALQVASMNPQDVTEFLKQAYIRDEKMTVEDLVKQTIGKLGENIIVRRFHRFELGE